MPPSSSSSSRSNNNNNTSPVPSPPRISFGTAGLRANFGPSLLEMNNLVVQQTAQGLARALEELLSVASCRSRGVVIGYDHRASAEHRCSSLSFALHTAAAFLARGFPVFLFDGFCPTPVLAFAITKLNCVAGCMITASHNPKQDAGFKLYWENGCQIVSPIDQQVEAQILKNLDPWPEALSLLELGEAYIRSRCVNPMVPIVNAYVEQVRLKLCRNLDDVQNLNEKNRFVYTPMHGVGLGVALAVFQKFNLPAPVIVDKQALPDADFPTVPYHRPGFGQ